MTINDNNYNGDDKNVVGLQPTVIASRAPHLLLENRGRASPVNKNVKMTAIMTIVVTKVTISNRNDNDNDKINDNSDNSERSKNMNKCQ